MPLPSPRIHGQVTVLPAPGRADTAMHILPPRLDRRGMTLRYIGALVLVAILAVVGQSAFLQVTGRARDDAAIINQSGRQRMFSQRIAAAALLLGQAGDRDQEDRARRMLEGAIRDMAASHAVVLALLAESGQEDMLAAYLRPPLDLAVRVRDFLDLAGRVAQERGRGPEQPVLLGAALERLLPDLEEAVRAHQATSEQRLHLLRTVAWGSVAAILAVLLLAARLVFRPMVEEVCRERDIIQGLNEELRRQAATDPLTGVPNRATFAQVAAREIEIFRRHGDPLSAVMLDIDHFKAVNDRHGHAVGDRVLQGVAEVVRDNVRQADHLFRWGGEEFLVLCPRTDAAEAAVEIGRASCRERV